MTSYNVSTYQLGDSSTLGEDRIKKLRNGGIKRITIDMVFAIGIGMHLQPEETETLMRKAGINYSDDDRDAYLEVMLRAMYMNTVASFNDALVRMQYKPLTDFS